jgi:hypothetical protein
VTVSLNGPGGGVTLVFGGGSVASGRIFSGRGPLPQDRAKTENARARERMAGAFSSDCLRRSNREMGLVTRL